VCGRPVEPDPAELAGRYGAETTVLEWREQSQKRQSARKRAAVFRLYFLLRPARSGAENAVIA